MNVFKILIVDDEVPQLSALESFLKRRQFQVFTADTGEKALKIIEENAIDLVLSDFKMPGWSGLVLLRKVKELNPEIEVVIITAYGGVEDAVEIMKAGAYDYLTKPIDLTELENLISRVREKRALITENRELRQQLMERFKFDTIISQSGEMESVLNTAGRVASSKASVLLRGESGTGKELIANAIHFASSRKNNPFIVVNVAALSENLIESELFGHEKGAFTGASQQRIGRFEQANGGTLFIDEVGDIPMSVQIKLLRAIQFGEIERIGSSQSIQLDVRIIAATHQPLEELIEKQKFREDLYYRLNVVSIQIPPLRKRKTDIPLLFQHYLEKYNQENNKGVNAVSSEVMDYLMKYPFPGNVRELENIIERAVVLCRGETIMLTDLPQQIQQAPEHQILDPHNLEDGYEEKLRNFEKTLILKALEETQGNQSAAARLLNMTERHLRSRLEKLGLK
jgi:two-component system NtrC family response regulator